MKVYEMEPTDGGSFNECDRRVVISRGYFPQSREDAGDHLFLMWGNHGRYNLTDKGARCPLEYVLAEDENGHEYETDDLKVKDGTFAFAVDLYDHSGLVFSFGGDDLTRESCQTDWDTTLGAAYLYVDRDQFESMCGTGKWMKIPEVVRDDFGEYDHVVWRDATEDEFREYLRERAANEIDELNLIESGYCWKYRVEKKIRLFEPDESEDEDTDENFYWEEEDECGGYLTEHADDINFPREDGLPVFYEEDVYFFRDEERGLEAYEYTIPEYVVTESDGSTGKRRYLSEEGCTGKCEWTDDLSKARIFGSRTEAQVIARKYVEEKSYDIRKNVVEIDRLRP